MPLEILFQSDEIIAINKPHGLLVHKTPLAKDAKTFALQELRNQIGQFVYPIHRLDRKTSGVLLFALNQEMQSKLSILFSERKVNKTYMAIVRGHLEGKGTIDYNLTNDKEKSQSAITHYKAIKLFELGVPYGKHATSRYTLVELMPETGRMHQLRKHMSHIFHPIIGDRPHGCNKQNKLWKDKWDMNDMLLHASHISLEVPNTEILSISASYSSSFTYALSVLDNE